MAVMFLHTLTNFSISSESSFTSTVCGTVSIDTNCILITRVGIRSTLIYVWEETRKCQKKKTLRDYVIRCVEEQLKTQQYAPTPTNVIRFSSWKGRTTSRGGAMRFKTLASLLLPQEMGCRCISEHLTNWLGNCQRSGIPFSWRVRQIC